MLLFSALEVRDEFAGTALEWYFQLAGAEAEADLLGSALVRARDTLARMEQLKSQGIRLPCTDRGIPASDRRPAIAAGAKPTRDRAT